MGDEKESWWEIFKLVMVGGGAAIVTAAYPFFRDWLAARGKRSEVDQQLRKEGFEAVIIRQDAQIKELQAGREADKEEIRQLREAESDCRVNQAKLEAKLEHLAAKIAVLENDSKRLPQQPQAVVAIQTDKVVGDIDSIIDNLTPEQLDKAKERIERRKPQ